MKTCSKCKIEKKESCFYVRNKKTGLLRTECIPCLNQIKKERYKENVEHVAAKGKEWRLNNKDKKKETDRKYRQANYPKIKARKQKWYANNKETVTAQRTRYGVENKKRIREVDRARDRERSISDLDYLLRKRLRNRIYYALQDKAASAATIKLIGCNVSFFIEHIQGLFKVGMTWENYGEWHLDHKKPLSWFDLTKQEEREEAFNYKNCQPLWGVENISKGNRYAHV